MDYMNPKEMNSVNNGGTRDMANKFGREKLELIRFKPMQLVCTCSQEETHLNTCTTTAQCVWTGVESKLYTFYTFLSCFTVFHMKCYLITVKNKCYVTQI